MRQEYYRPQAKGEVHRSDADGGTPRWRVPDPPGTDAKGWRAGLYAGFCTGPCGSVMAIPLGGRLPVRSCGLPEGHLAPESVSAGGQPIPSARPCSGWGLSSRRGHPRRWCALTAPFHPYLCGPRGSRHRRSVLCGTFLRVAPTGCYPAPCPVESGRSSDGSLAGPYAAIRPTRHRFHCYLRPAMDARLRPVGLRPPAGPLALDGPRGCAP